MIVFTVEQLATAKAPSEQRERKLHSSGTSSTNGVTRLFNPGATHLVARAASGKGEELRAHNGDVNSKFEVIRSLVCS